MTEDSKDWEKFKMDVAKFSGNYKEFLVIVGLNPGPGDEIVYWRASNQTWGQGAASRYLTFMDEKDKKSYRDQSPDE